MVLTRAGARAYLEARYRNAHGEATADWEANPGSAYDLEVWMTAFELANFEDVSPWDALLLAVKRRAHRVRLIDAILAAAWDDHRRLCEADPTYGNAEVPGDEVRKWMVESRNEERLLSRTAKMAVDAGVAKMMIERTQLEGRLLADALVAGLDTLDLTPDQRMKALGAAQQTLMQVAGDVPEGPATIPGIAIDGEDTKDDDE